MAITKSKILEAEFYRKIFRAIKYMPEKTTKGKMKMGIRVVPPFTNYKCPHCEKITSKWATKIGCNCHIEKQEIVCFNGIFYLELKGISNGDDESRSEDAGAGKEDKD